MHPIVVGITGASGSVLAQRCIESLLHLGRTPIVVHTNAGKRVWHDELGGSIEDWIAEKGCQTYPIENIGAPIASGTFQTDGMVVIPCSMGTLASIAHGLSSNLLERAADVTIKEKRRLVLVPRESPLSEIHLSNMLRLARLGVTLVSPVPAFYNHPRTIEDMVEHIVGRALSALGIEEALTERHRYVEEA